VDVIYVTCGTRPKTALDTRTMTLKLPQQYIGYTLRGVCTPGKRGAARGGGIYSPSGCGFTAGNRYTPAGTRQWLLEYEFIPVTKRSLRERNR